MLNNTHLNAIESQNSHLNENNDNYKYSSEYLLSIRPNMSMTEYLKMKRFRLHSCLFKKAKQVSLGDGPFVWSARERGLLFISFYAGHLLTEFAGAWLSFRFGSKLVILVSLALSSTLVILTHVCATLHFWSLFVNRLLIGCANVSLCYLIEIKFI